MFRILGKGVNALTHKAPAGSRKASMFSPETVEALSSAADHLGVSMNYLGKGVVGAAADALPFAAGVVFVGASNYAASELLGQEALDSSSPAALSAYNFS